MKRRALLLIALCALCLLCLSGCRTRTVADPALADAVVTPEPTPTPTPTPEPTPTPTPEPTPTPTPGPTPEPAPEPAPTPSKPPEAGTATDSPDGEGGGPLSPAQSDPTPTPDPSPTPEAEPSPQPTQGGGTTGALTLDGNGGRVNSKDLYREMREGEQIGSLPTPTRDGYLFDGWYTDPEGGEKVGSATLFAGSVTLYAHWTYDPLTYWFTVLANRIQQVYLCQQETIYFELQTTGTLAQNSYMLNFLGSVYSSKGQTWEDEWLLSKGVATVVKELADGDSPDEIGTAMAGRFPEREIVLARDIGTQAQAVYAGLALSARLYPDWFEDVDLAKAAGELEASEDCLIFYTQKGGT